MTDRERWSPPRYARDRNLPPLGKWYVRKFWRKDGCYAHYGLKVGRVGLFEVGGWIRVPLRWKPGARGWVRIVSSEESK